MTISVPESRIALVESEVGVSESVRSVSWVHAARLHNWIVGRPVTVVPCFRPGGQDGQNSTVNYYFRWKPRYQDTRYYLKLLLSTPPGALSPEGPVPLTVTVPVGGTAYANQLARVRLSPASEIEIVHDVASQSTTEMEFSFSVGDPTDTGVWGIDACSIEAAPRTFLTDDANDLGVDRLRFWPRGPITESDLGKIVARQNEVRAAARRVGGFHHAFGDLDPMPFTSGTFADLFDDPFSLLGRYLYNGDTTRTWNWRIRAKCSDGSTAGEVQINNVSDGTATGGILTIPAGTTSATWLPSTAGSPMSFTSDCEDPSAADGLRGAAWDDHNVQVRRTAGAGTITIESISIWEA